MILYEEKLGQKSSITQNFQVADTPILRALIKMKLGKISLLEH